MVGRRTRPGTWARTHMMSECGGPGLACLMAKTATPAETSSHGGSRCTLSARSAARATPASPGKWAENHADNDGQNSPQRQSRRQMCCASTVALQDRTASTSPADHHTRALVMTMMTEPKKHLGMPHGMSAHTELRYTAHPGFLIVI